MEDELMVIETVKEVGSALTSFIKLYKENRIISKMQKKCVLDKIKCYQAVQRTNNVGLIVENNIKQISKTFQLIEKLDFQGSSQKMAMQQLEILNDTLCGILEDYRRGF